jgi:hypothetical protein
MSVEQLMELELARKIDEFGENLLESYVIHHKSHMT